MSIKNTIAHGTTPHGVVHIWHEADADHVDELHPSEDEIFLRFVFGRTDTTHRIPAGLWRVLVRQILPTSTPPQGHS